MHSTQPGTARYHRVMGTLADRLRRLWRRLLAVSIRTKILGMVVGILVYWLGLVILRRFLAERLLGPAMEAETFVDMILLVSIVLFLPPSLLVAYLLTRAMTTPILELTRVADAVGRGDLSQRARVKSGTKSQTWRRRSIACSTNSAERSAKHANTTTHAPAAPAHQRSRRGAAPRRP